MHPPNGKNRRADPCHRIGLSKGTTCHRQCHPVSRLAFAYSGCNEQTRRGRAGGKRGCEWSLSPDSRSLRWQHAIQASLKSNGFQGSWQPARTGDPLPQTRSAPVGEQDACVGSFGEKKNRNLNLAGSREAKGEAS